MFVVYFCIAVLAFVFGIIIGGLFMGLRLNGKISFFYELSEKYYDMVRLFSIWMEGIEQGEEVSEKLEKMGYHKVAIYGIGYLGKRLVAQLEDTNVDVRYIIDKRAGSVYENVPIYSLSPELEAVDVIIITPCYYHYLLEKEIKATVPYDIIALDKIVK